MEGYWFSDMKGDNIQIEQGGETDGGWVGGDREGK